MTPRRLDYRTDVLPALTCAVVFGSHEWTQRTSRPWGWRSRCCPACGEGSSKPGRLSVDPGKLVWRCHACDVGGDPARWVEITEGLDFRSAVKVLASRAGIIHSTPTSRPKTSRVPKVPLPPEKPAEAPDTRPAALWQDGLPLDDTPASRYLRSVRLCWPGWDFPDSLRWFWTGSYRLHETQPPGGLPKDAAGVLAFAYRNQAGDVQALKLEAISLAGALSNPRWRRNFGSVVGSRFTACNLPGGALHVGEGELSALALAVQCRSRGAGAAIATGGASGLTPAACWDSESRPVRIHTDRDPKGLDRAWKLKVSLCKAGRAVEVADDLNDVQTDGTDAADVLLAVIGERAAISEYDGGLPRLEAEARAWEWLIRELGKGSFDL